MQRSGILQLGAASAWALLCGMLFCAFAIEAPAVAAEGCRPKQVTKLAASCGNLWNPTASKRFDPWEIEVDAAVAGRQLLSRANCPEMQLLEVHSTDGLAQVKCSTGLKGWVNLGSLECDDENVTRRKLQELELFGPKNAEYCPTCIAQQATQVAPLDPLSVFSVTYTGFDLPSSVQKESILRKAMDKIVSAISRARQDRYSLIGRYKNLSDQEITERFRSAAQALKQQFEQVRNVMGDDCQNGTFKNDADKTRAERACLNLKSAAEFGQGLAINSVGLKAYLKDAEMDNQMSRASDQTLRTVLFYGLDENERRSLTSKGKLSLTREVNEIRGQRFFEVHNGYVYGGARLGMNADASYDCSDFVYDVLAGKGRNSGVSPIPSVEVFKNIAEEKKGVPGARVSLMWKGLASCFDRLKLEDGEMPTAGDIALYQRRAGSAGAHIAFVTEYDRRNGAVVTMEAIGGLDSGMGLVVRPLFEPSCQTTSRREADQGDWNVRPVRAGLHVLRLKADPPSTCPIRPPR